MNQKKLGKLRFKKFIVLLLTMSFITLSVTSQSSVTAASEPDISKPVELKWYVLGNGPEKDIDMVENAVNKYIKNKINATLKLNTLSWGDDFENKMAAKIASREEFDITFTAYWALDYAKNAKKGAFFDITNMMDTYAPKTKAFLGEKTIKGAKVDGKLYAIPTFSPSRVNCYGVLLNKRLVSKYKVDTSKIKKLSDLEPIFKKIKAKEPKIIDFYPFDTSGSDSIYETLNFERLGDIRTPGSVKSDGKSTKVINDFESSEAKALFSLMNKWYKSGYISHTIPSEYDYDNYEFFKKNNSNIFAFYSYLNPMRCEDISAQYGIDTVAVELTKPAITTSNVTGSMQAISSTSKNPERALMFLELVNTDEKLSNLLNYGIEGIHYEKTGEKTIYQTNYEDYNPSLMWAFGNQSIAYSLPGQDPKLWTKVISNYKSAYVSPLLGFSFNSNPVASQISKLQNVVNKYYYKLSLGKVDPAVYLPKMNKELKNAGLQKVLIEMQKQVDAFKKSESK